ncbi:unnamed protein product [Boreogadus saida]
MRSQRSPLKPSHRISAVTPPITGEQDLLGGEHVLLGGENMGRTCSRGEENVFSGWRRPLDTEQRGVLTVCEVACAALV